MIKVENLGVSFAGETIFKDGNFLINKGEKIGLIGRNGTGKSTFLKVLSGDVEPNEGGIRYPKYYRMGHLNQHLTFTCDTVLEEVCSVLDEERQYDAWKGERILMGLGFSENDFSKSPDLFSGGYQIKINLAKLLLAEPHMLLLDEPTNYLDIYAVRWLETFLKEWDGELLLITHDRAFMDRVVTHTLHVYRHQFTKRPGNTKGLYESIAAQEEHYEKTRQNEEKKRKETEEWVNRFKAKATFASRARSKMKMLEKQDVKEKLQHIETLDFFFNEKSYQGSAPLLDVRDVGFGYDKDKVLFKGVKVSLKSGDKVCVIGKNGKGKSTFLRLLAKEMEPLSGEVSLSNKAEVGYFGQMNIDRLHAEHTIIQEMQKGGERVSQSDLRRVCAHMLFSGDAAQKKIGVLSGGEKSRVMLGKILLKQNNILLLDEPTNHLDMESCEALLSAILSFSGVVVMVTHNEYFLHEMANKLIVFDEGKVSLFEGGYKEFLKKVGWKEELDY